MVDYLMIAFYALRLFIFGSLFFLTAFSIIKFIPKKYQKKLGLL